MGLFQKLILDFPDSDWDWNLVSSNPSISLDFVLQHPNLPWLPKYVSMNSSITEADVVSNLEYPWDFEGLCMNPNMSMSFFNRYVVKPVEVHRIDWHLLSSNPSITMIDVINNPTYSWDDRYLSLNPNLTSNFILNEGKSRNWYVPLVSSNSGITERDIFKSTLSSMFDWDYRNLSANPNLPIAFVNNHMKKNWNFHSISTQASIQDINIFQKVKWDGHGLSMNENISYDYVQLHRNVKWDYASLLMNKGVSFASIIDNYNLFKAKLESRNGTIESYLSSNPNLTNQWVKDNQSLVDWKRLSSNTLN